MSSRLRPRHVLDGLPAYKAGRPAPAVPGLTPYKISSNENPYPPLPAVAEAIAAAAGRVNRYPDPVSGDLAAAIGEKLGVAAGEVVVGAGSAGILSELLTAFAGPGDEVLFAWRSFEAYPIMVGLTGATPVRVPLTADGRHDLPAMARAITSRTQVVLLCTPNNPTGPAIRDDELEAFLTACPEDVLVVVDEAYLHFVTDPDAADGLDAFRRHANVVLLRTFSKAYGLAGLRVGAALAHPTVAAALHTAAVPFAVSAVAQAAALASLDTDAEAELRGRVARLVGERTRVLTALRELGWPVPDAQGNFYWLPLGELTEKFALAAESRALMLRAFAPEGVRVTVDVPEANDRLVALAREFDRDYTGQLPWQAGR